MIILRVGDPHVQPSNLEESERLMQFSLDIAKLYNVQRIEILGDLLHSHAVVRGEVLSFWDKWFKILDESFDTVVLVGNHDKFSHGSTAHSLSVFKTKYNKKVKIIDQPTPIGIFSYIPYIHDQNQFVKAENTMVEKGAKVVVCHQTIDGVSFESGMYAPNGAKLELLKAPLIISGHHHNRQRFGRINYIGTPRWLTSSDANEPKGIYLAIHDDQTGIVLEEQYFDTSGVCTPIYKLQWKEGEEKPKLYENAKNTIELVGTSEWISKQKSSLKGTCSITSRVTDSKKARWKPAKSENTLEKFILQKFQVSTGLTKEKLLEFIQKEGLNLV